VNRCTECEACDPRFRHNHLTKIQWMQNGCMAELKLPHRNGITLDYSVKRSPIPFTPPWEWTVSNIPATLFPGMTNGYCRTRVGALMAVGRALAFWRLLGYVTTLDGAE